MWYNNPSEMTQIACYPYPGTDSSDPKEASIMFWSVLGAVLLLALAAAIYSRKRSGTHVRNSQHGQPWKNDGQPETPGWNPSSMGGGDFFF
jgi:hypothetical protein